MILVSSAVLFKPFEVLLFYLAPLPDCVISESRLLGSSYLVKSRGQSSSRAGRVFAFTWRQLRFNPQHSVWSPKCSSAPPQQKSKDINRSCSICCNSSDSLHIRLKDQLLRARDSTEYLSGFFPLITNSGSDGTGSNEHCQGSVLNTKQE